MRKFVIPIAALMGLTGCACGQTKREAILAKALKDTNRELTWSRDQNEIYSRQLHEALDKLRKKKRR